MSILVRNSEAIPTELQTCLVLICTSASVAFEMQIKNCMFRGPNTISLIKYTPRTDRAQSRGKKAPILQGLHRSTGEDSERPLVQWKKLERVGAIVLRVLATRLGSKNRKYVLHLVRTGCIYLKLLDGWSEKPLQIQMENQVGSHGGAVAIPFLSFALHVTLWQKYSFSQTHYM